MWGYYWGYTMAQIQLLTSDTPVIVYKNLKDNKNKEKKPKRDEVQKAADEWRKKYSDATKKLNINLSDFN